MFPKQSTNWQNHQRRTIYNHLFAYKLQHIPFCLSRPKVSNSTALFREDRKVVKTTYQFNFEKSSFTQSFEWITNQIWRYLLKKRQQSKQNEVALLQHSVLFHFRHCVELCWQLGIVEEKFDCLVSSDSFVCVIRILFTTAHTLYENKSRHFAMKKMRL